MGNNIEDFFQSLPEMNLEEAKRIYREAQTVDNFQRIELYGAHEFSRSGFQMVYVIGMGNDPSNFPDESERSLFYSPCMITSDFFGNVKERREIHSICVDSIKGIRLLGVSSELAIEPKE